MWKFKTLLKREARTSIWPIPVLDWYFEKSKKIEDVEPKHSIRYKNHFANVCTTNSYNISGLSFITSNLLSPLLPYLSDGKLRSPGTIFVVILLQCNTVLLCSIC